MRVCVAVRHGLLSSLVGVVWLARRRWRQQHGHCMRTRLASVRVMSTSERRTSWVALCWAPTSRAWTGSPDHRACYAAASKPLVEQPWHQHQNSTNHDAGVSVHLTSPAVHWPQSNNVHSIQSQPCANKLQRAVAANLLSSTAAGATAGNAVRTYGLRQPCLLERPFANHNACTCLRLISCQTCPCCSLSQQQ